MKGYHIYLIRHGSTVANENGTYIGHTDYSLSEKGIAELKDKAEKHIYPKTERIYSSPLKRCTETAKILFPDKEILCLEGIKELNLGDFDGKNVEELINNEDYKKWLKGGFEFAPPNGESVKALTIRSFDALNKIIINMMNEDIVNATIISHSGVISNMLTCFGLPKLTEEDLRHEPGEGYEILVTAQMWQQANAFEIISRVPYYE